MHGAAMLQIAHQCYVKSVECSQLLANGERIKQRLSGMLAYT